ncbi:class I SAM-dependent methyltransferase [bacterium]|nr:MAG: class I SAM-dependent methyltransferase [bacterium]
MREINSNTDTDFSYETDDLNDMSEAQNYNAWIISLVKPYIGKSILEVGAGCGNFTQALIEHTDSLITCIEPSSTQYRVLKQVEQKNTSRVKTFHGFSVALSKKDTFDTIIYNNVLEHIEHDMEELSHIKKHLNPGGHLIIYSPALPFLMSEFDKSIGHFHRYTKKEIIQKVEQAGLQTVHFQYVDFIGIWLWFIKFKWLKSKTLGPSSVKTFDTLLVPIIRNLERVINIPIGKNVLVVAK